MKKWNKILQRQVLKHMGNQTIPAPILPLLDAISDSYDHHDKELSLLNRCMNLSSEELFTANAQLRKRNEELDRFVYSASHDLRAPLTSILGLLHIIELSGENGEDIKENLQYIKSSAVKLDEFIKDIILYTRNKKVSLQREEVDFDKILTECNNKLSYYRDGKFIDQTSKVTAEFEFYSDPQRLDTILSNILSNSIKYRDATKNKSFVHIDISINAKGATLIIEDNGIGIEEEELDKIFHMFHRSTHHSDGSGIGLYIVKEIVDKLSGTIDVKSVFGQGTVFEICLPNLIDQP